MSTDDTRDDAAAEADVRQLVADARAADDAYKVAAIRAALYEFLHRYAIGQPGFGVALDLASSLREIVDDLAETDAAGPVAESPAPAPAGRPATATAPSAPVSEAALDAVALFWKEAHAILQAYPSAALARAMLEGAAPLIAAERAEQAEAQLAEVRQTIAAFLAHHGNSAAFALQTARDLAEGIRQVLDRAPLEALSAVCTGPDCGEQFADSETGEYLFATRERMELLLYADGWADGPVLCPACQEEEA